MRDLRKYLLPALSILAAWVLLQQQWGCKKDEGPTNPPADTTKPQHPYGTGAMSFDALNGGGLFSAIGPYTPSDKFANDTASQGAGGFVHDTTLFRNKITGMFAGYTHVLANGILNERIMVIALHSPAASLATGDYPWSQSDASQPGQASYVYFFLSDSVNVHTVFVAKSGMVTLTAFDSTTSHAHASFSGTLWGLPPDTSQQIQISNGEFDVTFSRTYFNY